MSRLESHERPDDLDLERRLESWRPATGGALSRERMLYAAGRAAPHPAAWRMCGRAAQFALALLLAGIGLGTGWQIERGAR